MKFSSFLGLIIDGSVYHCIHLETALLTNKHNKINNILLILKVV